MKLLRCKSVVVSLVLFGAMSIVPQAGAAAVTRTIHMGGGVPQGFTSRALAPRIDGAPVVKIHSGDTVDLRGGPVYLLPVGVDPLDWQERYATNLDSPFGGVASDPDADTPQMDSPYKLGASQSAPPANCGDTEAGQCVYAGHNSDPVAGVFSGGDRSGAGNHLFVRIDADPGESIYALGPGAVSMQSVLRIDVVASNEAITSQTSIDNAKNKLLGQEVDLAEALNAKLNIDTKHKLKDGTVVHDAFAGYDTATISLIAFYPHKMVLHKGDRVRWHFAQLENEIHGVAFPFKKAKALSNGIVNPVCDPDGDGGPGPDTPPAGPDCGSGTFELDLNPASTAERGDGVFPGGPKALESSGVRGRSVPSVPTIAGGLDPYDLRFNKTSSDKGFRYACTIHGAFMSGTVVVKP
jgi:plastocyanin